MKNTRFDAMDEASCRSRRNARNPVGRTITVVLAILSIMAITFWLSVEAHTWIHATFGP